MTRLVITAGLAFGLCAHAASPHEELKALAVQLQKSPLDEALRAKIVTLAATLKPGPAIPTEARRPFVMAGTFQKDAKSAEDFAAAIKSYEEALTLAPWWGDAYYNLSVSLESVGRHGEAIKAIKLYLLGKPADAEQAEDRLYALEAKEAVAAKEKAKKAKTLIVPGVSIGPAKIGMTEAEAVAVLGAPTERFDYDNDNGYRGVSLTWGVPPDSVYMDFHRYQPTEFVNTGQAQYMTAEGVGPGMPLAEATALLGAPAKSKNYGSTVEVCYRTGLKLGYNAGSTKVNYVVVFHPSSFNSWCPG